MEGRAQGQRLGSAYLSAKPAAFQADRHHGSLLLRRAESKIMNAASKLAAMAKVLETPVKGKPGRNYCFQSESC